MRELEPEPQQFPIAIVSASPPDERLQRLDRGIAIMETGFTMLDLQELEGGRDAVGRSASLMKGVLLPTT